ncbi:hypothetical protein VNO78_15319 [Psophocarpus tetragonolobus]|uniref:Uncharacterized protein n=1 Tax=Psophocarpus tetragonolobus TaxID=3891 RepID=A0AAN9SGA4_PSOTE
MFSPQGEYGVGVRWMHGMVKRPSRVPRLAHRIVKADVMGLRCNFAPTMKVSLAAQLAKINKSCSSPSSQNGQSS